MARTETRVVAAHHGTGTRLSFAVLGYYLAVIAVLTLVPFRFELPDRYTWLLGGTLFDTVANVLLFLPLGFLYRLARPTRPGGSALRVLAAGLLVSALIEAVQLFEPVRYSSPIDVLANGFGAWSGALLADRVARWVRPDAGLVGRLSLGIPLMGLVYMLVPLLWLGSLAAGSASWRLAVLLLPGLFGARLLVFVHRHRLGRPGAVTPRGVALAAGAGMLIGVFPSVAAQPFAAPLLALLVALSVWIQLWRGAVSPSGERRFELPALRSAVPLFAAYLIVSAWLGRGVGPLGAGAALERRAILGVLELVASFTVLGYLLAEWRGRLDLPLRIAARDVLARAAPLGAVAIAIRFLHEDPPAALWWSVLLVLSSLYGAALYDAQRAHVRALIDATSGVDVREGAREPWMRAVRTSSR